MQIELPSTGCLIRPFAPEDAPALQRHANNRKIWLNLRDLFPHPYELSHAEGYISMLAKENPPCSHAITKDGEAIGSIGLRFGQDVHRKSAEFGYWLGETFWGRGIASEAALAFSTAAFAAYDLNRIYSEVFANNPASIRILEKAGFICEGRLRSSVIKDGVVLDSLLYARIRN